MLFGPFRWAIRIALLVAAAIFLYFAVTLVQVWLTSRQYDPHPAEAILVMGAAQYNCTPSATTCRPGSDPGADAVPPGLHAPDHGDGEQGAR